jgi:site-specific recombinase XerD
MRIKYVEDIGWSGGAISTYVIIDDGSLSEQSIVAAPVPYLIYLAQNGRQKNSIRANANDLCSFFQALKDHGQDWRRLTDRDMSGYLYGYLLKARSCSDATIERHISTLTNFYAHAWTVGLLEIPPSFTYTYVSGEEKVQGYGERKVNFDLFNKYIERKIFEHLLSHIKTQAPFEKERDETVMYLGYLCGLRNAEVTDPRNLRTDLLDKLFKDAEKANVNTIVVPIFGKGNKLRKVEVQPKAFLKIKTFLYGRRASAPTGPLICKKDGGVLFNGHASYTFKSCRVAAAFRIGSVLAELDEKNPSLHLLTESSFEKLTFHALRHTFATNLVDFCYKHGYDPWPYVSDQLGHEDRATTREYIVFDGRLHRRQNTNWATNNDDN